MIGQYVTGKGDVISHVNITSVRVADGGLYRCEAKNSAGLEIHSARLNIYGPPHVRSMGDLSAVDGETFKVTCPVGGHPIDKIIWKKGLFLFYFAHFQYLNIKICFSYFMLISDNNDTDNKKAYPYEICVSFSLLFHKREGYFII